VSMSARSKTQAKSDTASASKYRSECSYSCDIAECPFRSKDKGKRDGHVESCHSVHPSAYICTKCTYSTTRPKQLTDHLKQHKHMESHFRKNFKKTEGVDQSPSVANSDSLKKRKGGKMDMDKKRKKEKGKEREDTIADEQGEDERDSTSFDAKTNRLRGPHILPKPHPGFQGSKLIIDLMSGEAVVEGQDGRKTGFTTLSSIVLHPRDGVASNVIFSTNQPPKVEINGKYTSANEDSDCCMHNAVIDVLNCDRERSERFNTWTANGDIVMRSAVARHRFAPREDWKEKQERIRREEKEEWGEWE
ncbi:hypothetical protein PENTCL1PPCAC_26859, partial [Pristionchus entomophagus]